jgi:hypothetical protein
VGEPARLSLPRWFDAGRSVPSTHRRRSREQPAEKATGDIRDAARMTHAVTGPRPAPAPRRPDRPSQTPRAASAAARAVIRESDVIDNTSTLQRRHTNEASPHTPARRATSTVGSAMLAVLLLCVPPPLEPGERPIPFASLTPAQAAALAGRLRLYKVTLDSAATEVGGRVGYGVQHDDGPAVRDRQPGAIRRVYRRQAEILVHRRLSRPRPSLRLGFRAPGPFLHR